jgi:tetratricopeptide (TPR) repeat protein
LFIGAMSLVPLGARAEDLSAIENQLAILESEAGRIEQAFQGQIDLSNQMSVEERLSQGELFFVLELWDQAATVLYGAVSQGRGHPGYSEGLYQLAESLYRMADFSGARTYFAEVLTRPDSQHKTLAIQRLVVIAERLRDWDGLDEYYRTYMAQSGGEVPSEVLYLRGKGLFLTRRDRDAIETLAGVPRGDSWYLRARYLAAATKVRAGNLEEALADYTVLVGEPPIAAEDRHVLELVHLARGRLLYELDRLGEAFDAYQNISWDSDMLTSMLYEVTWLYVRRGQLASVDETLSERERDRRSLEEYKLALVQLRELRSLEPDSSSAAYTSLLMGSLRLQRAEYDSAYEAFEAVQSEYASADATMAKLMSDGPQRGRIIQDILAMEAGALAVQSELPALAARRAADNKGVREAVRVFRELQARRDELTAVEKLVKKLDTLLSTDNPAELFPDLQEGLARSVALENEVLSLRARLAGLQHLAAKVPPEAQGRLATARRAREDLARKVATLPTTGEGMIARKGRFDDGFKKLERDLKDVSNAIAQRRAQLVALDMLHGQARRAPDTAPHALDNERRKIKGLLAVIQSWEDERERIAETLDEARLSTTLSGGRGAAEGDLRAAYQRALDEENRLLASAAESDELRRLRAVDRRANSLRDRNRRFLGALTAVVDVHVAEMRALVEVERRNLSSYAGSVERVNGDAGAVHDEAARLALDLVRAEIQDVVVRSDVGLVDVTFAKKQQETEKVGRLQRQKAQELTDLSQAYSDLTREEAD